MSNALDLFKAAIEATGMTPPDDVIDDGVIHRFDADGRKGKKTGWYVLHTDGIAAGEFGCWKTGIQSSWCSKDRDALTDTERQRYRERMEATKRLREAETKARHTEAQADCAKLWEASKPCPDGGHTYLVNKGVKPYGVNLQRDMLLIPLRIGKDLVSLQFIGADGTKRFKTGGRVQGAYCAIGKPKETMVICEGWATGASIHEATGYAVAVAFNAGNLKAVAMALKDKLPQAKIIIAADDDIRTEGNPGMAKATEAARVVGGFLAVPDFGSHKPEGATDFNDLHQLSGLATVKRCIDLATAQAHVIPEQSVTASTDGVVLTNGADLTPEAVQWLWKGWLAAGKLHILAGAPGQGKTTIATALAAAVTKGEAFPDGTRCKAGNILIWSGEDDPADTLLPRLMAHGADVTRCYFVTGTRRDGELQPFDPSQDMAGLELQALSIGGVSLLIVDPVVSAVTGDSHKNTEVRRALQPLVDLASRLGAAILGISHFSKGGAGGDPASRVVGSIAFTAVARVVLVAAKVKAADGAERRIFARGKSNIGPDDGGFEYEIGQTEPLKGIHASQIVWGECVNGSAKELLTDAEDDGGESNDAADLLKSELSTTEWTNSELAMEPLKKAGFTKKQIWSASKRLNVSRKKGGMKDGWYWLLPSAHEDSNSPKIPEDSPFRNKESSEPSVESSGEFPLMESSLEASGVIDFEVF